MEKNRGGFVFVGRHDVPVGRCGCIAFPDDWLFGLVGKSGKLYVRFGDEEKCLCLIPSDVMESELKQIRKRALNNSALNEAIEVLGANTEQVEIVDGKVRIGKAMLKRAGINGSAVMTGAIRIVKLWNPVVLSSVDAMNPEIDSALKAAGFAD